MLDKDKFNNTQLLSNLIQSKSGYSHQTYQFCIFRYLGTNDFKNGDFKIRIVM